MSLPLTDEPCPEPEIELCPVPQAASQARAFVRHQLTEFGFPELVDDGALIAVELVTNAVREAPNGTVLLSLRLSAGRPVIEVRDRSPVLPVIKDADCVAESGRGLRIVGALAAELGWRRAGRGKVVWAVLRTP
ncbi:MAG TPA: ATP-binding protein [Streptosporangiaceae bacterium]|nr:ATP-binding protein [Streptosporangiaceae bacterium]